MSVKRHADGVQQTTAQQRFLDNRNSGCSGAIAQVFAGCGSNENGGDQNIPIAEVSDQFQSIHPRHVIIDYKTASVGQAIFVQQFLRTGDRRAPESLRPPV